MSYLLHIMHNYDMDEWDEFDLRQVTDNHLLVVGTRSSGDATTKIVIV